MDISYKNDVTHSFLVIEPDGEVDTKAYPIRMVLGNTIPGLLPCTLQKADGKVLFYYEVTARQQISDVYQKLTHGELKNIYMELLKIFEQMDMYLLDTGHLLLEPEYIYLDRSEDNLCLCYLPGYDKPMREQLRYLTEYLLPRIEHQDPKGVMLGYGLYRLLMEDNFQMETVSEMLHRSKWEQERAPGTPTDMAEGDEMYREDQERAKEEMDGSGRTDRAQPWKEGWGKDLLLLLSGLFLISGFVILRQMGYLGAVSLPMMLVFFFCMILLAALVIWKDRKREEKREGDEEGADLYEHGMEWGAGEDREREEYLSQGEETVVLYRSPGYGCPLLVCEETGQAPPIILDRDMIVVGKMAGVSDALLDRPAISRVHARIQKKEQGYWIADLDSKNGTFINGKRLGRGEEYLLQAEDLVVFADISYRFNV